MGTKEISNKMGQNKYLSICFFLMLFISDVYSQNLNFEHINYTEVHSPSMISSIIQDKEGFIWFGTQGGLVKYDGYNFIRYVRNKNEQGGLSNNRVNVIYEDRKGNLWIGTSNGINLFNKDTKKFTPIDIPPIKGGRNYITTIIEDDDENIWIGTFGGVKKLNKEQQLLESFPKESRLELFNSLKVLSLFYDKNTGILVGTSNGLKCFNPKNGQLKNLPNTIRKNDALVNAKVWKIVKEKNGDFWFATETQGVFKYSKSKNIIINYTADTKGSQSIAANRVHEVLLVDSNTVWFATIDGLTVLKKDKEEITNHRHNALNNNSLSDNEVTACFKDKNGSIWVGTSTGELHFFSTLNYNFMNIRETVKPNFGLTNPVVKSLTKENQHAFWVGTNGDGLNYIDLQSKQIDNYKIIAQDETNVNMIFALRNLNEEYLLCGTNNGLYQFNKKSHLFKNIPLENNSAINNVAVTALLVDETKIWVGTLGNGFKSIALNDNTVTTYKSNSNEYSLSDDFITDIENDGNEIWIATQDGLNVFDKNLNKITSIYRSGENNTISNNNLTTLFKDSKDRLWIGTDFGGLNLYDKKTQTFYLFNKADGLTDESIKSISEDENGNIWVGSEGLLFKIKMDKVIYPINKNKIKITAYSLRDGLMSGQFSENCSINLNEHQLIFGSSKGLTIFDANHIIKSPNTGQIVLTKLKINNKEVNVLEDESPLKKSISNTSEIVLNYNQNYIEIEFSAMNFVNPKNNKYAYKLESANRKDEWHIINSQNSVNLIDLKPGDYVFSIKTSSEANEWNPNIKTLKIRVLPPWWKSIWAYFIYVIVVIISIYIIYKSVNNRLQLKKELFIESVKNERQEELLQMKMNFFTNVSHEIKTPLSLIIAPIEDLLEIVEKNSVIEKRLKTIKNNSDRLLKLVTELLDFRKTENGSLKIYCTQQDIVSFCFDIYESFKALAIEKEITYKFAIDANSIPVYFDKHQMEKVIYNLLSNAFKVTKKKGQIVLLVEGRNQTPGWVNIKVKDNGIGIPTKDKKNLFQRFYQIENSFIQKSGTGIGLALSKNIIELHKGNIELLDEEDSWANTTFQISLQLGTNHLTKTQIIENEFIINDLFEEVNSNVVTGKSVAVSNIEEDSLIMNNENDADKKSILIVEDNDEFRKYLKDILSEDYNIFDFPNGIAAIDYLEEDLPDLIVSDVMMPEMNGLELCEYVKTNESTNHIPVILLTAKTSINNKIEGLTTGADSYIEKPFSVKVLKLNIINLLSAKEILRHKYSGNFIIDSELKSITTPEEVFLKKLMEIIETNIEDSEFDVNKLVREIGMSRTVLYKKVKTLTNHSVATLIKHLRLKKAGDILLNTSYSVSDVAYMVGFNDRKHFSREFKKVYELSPIQFKKSKEDNEG